MHGGKQSQHNSSHCIYLRISKQSQSLRVKSQKGTIYSVCKVKQNKKDKNYLKNPDKNQSDTMCISLHPPPKTRKIINTRSYCTGDHCRMWFNQMPQLKDLTHTHTHTKTTPKIKDKN